MEILIEWKISMEFSVSDRQTSRFEFRYSNEKIFFVILTWFERNRCGFESRVVAESFLWKEKRCLRFERIHFAYSPSEIRRLRNSNALHIHLSRSIVSVHMRHTHTQHTHAFTPPINIYHFAEQQLPIIWHSRFVYVPHVVRTNCHLIFFVSADMTMHLNATSIHRYFDADSYKLL